MEDIKFMYGMGFSGSTYYAIVGDKIIDLGNDEDKAKVKAKELFGIDVVSFKWDGTL